MVFNDTSSGNGLIQEIERITNLGATGVSGNTQKLKDFTARINNGLDRFYTLAFQFDQLWNFDDANQIDIPVATTDLVTSQSDYTFDSSLLSVTQIFAKDSTGVLQELQMQDDRNAPDAYTKTTAGVPTTYELVGNSILLSPIPNYNSTDGLEVTFKRNGLHFSYSAGAAVIGIPSLFHPYLARYASYPYLVEKSLKHANAVQLLIQQDEGAIKQFISNRAKPKRSGLKVKQEDNR